VGDLEAAARAEHPEGLTENLVLVGREVDDAIGDDDVDRICVDGEMFDFAEAEFDVRSANLCGILAGEGDHLGGHVDPEHAAFGAHHLCCEEAIDAAAGAEVEHCFAGLKGSDGGGVAAAKRHVCDSCGEVIDAALGVHFRAAHDLDVAHNCCATAITASGCVTGGSATGIGG